jgi:hypothetical protein
LLECPESFWYRHSPECSQGIGVPAGKRERLIIPQSAIRRIGQLEFAYVLEGSRVEQRLITTGEDISGGRADVLSGLSEGVKAVTPWRDVDK